MTAVVGDVDITWNLWKPTRFHWSQLYMVESIGIDGVDGGNCNCEYKQQYLFIFSFSVSCFLFFFLVADTQLYKRLCPSVRRSVRPSVTTSRKVGKRAFKKLFAYGSELGRGLGGALGVNGGWLPLPTRPQQYCDPASLVLSFFHSFFLIFFFLRFPFYFSCYFFP